MSANMSVNMHNPLNNVLRDLYNKCRPGLLLRGIVVCRVHQSVHTGTDGMGACVQHASQGQQGCPPAGMHPSVLSCGKFCLECTVCVDEDMYQSATEGATHFLW